MVVFHLYGQHVSANARYPNTSPWLYFTADSIRRKDLARESREEVSHYDNATRYNDAVVDSIFSLFSEEEAVCVYISDHGDEVNDYRLHLGRSHERPLTANQVKYQFEIPMMIWFSDSYRERHPEVVSRLRERVDTPYMVDDMPHLLFDLAGIASPHFNRNYSLLDEDYDVRSKRNLVLSSQTYEEVTKR